MDTHFVLANSYTRANRNDLAFSALPDAPVLPYVERRRHLRAIGAATSGLTRHISRHIPRLRHGPQCSEPSPA